MCNGISRECHVIEGVFVSSFDRAGEYCTRSRKPSIRFPQDLCCAAAPASALDGLSTVPGGWNGCNAERSSGGSFAPSGNSASRPFPRSHSCPKTRYFYVPAVVLHTFCKSSDRPPNSHQAPILAHYSFAMPTRYLLIVAKADSHSGVSNILLKPHRSRNQISVPTRVSLRLLMNVSKSQFHLIADHQNRLTKSIALAHLPNIPRDAPSSTVSWTESHNQKTAASNTSRGPYHFW